MNITHGKRMVYEPVEMWDDDGHRTANNLRKIYDRLRKRSLRHHSSAYRKAYIAGVRDGLNEVYRGV